MYICEGTLKIINATANLAANINWTPAASLDNANALTPITSAVQTTKYSINANYGSCSRIDSVTINVRPAPIPDAGSDETICYGIAAQLNASGGEEYNWRSDPTFITGTDISNPVVKPSVTTSYFLHVKDIHGCNSLQPDEMRVIVPPLRYIFSPEEIQLSLPISPYNCMPSKQTIVA